MDELRETERGGMKTWKFGVRHPGEIFFFVRVATSAVTGRGPFVNVQIVVISQKADNGAISRWQE